MITRTTHVGIYVVKSLDGLEYKNRLVAQLYTGKKSNVGDCLEDMTLPTDLRCGTYFDFGKTILSRVPYSLTRRNKEKPQIDPQLVVFHPGVKQDTEPVSREQLVKIAEGAMKFFATSGYDLPFKLDETPIRLE